jgi:hypothetical protein
VALPVSVDGLTLEWMGEVLDRDLASIEVDEIIWGTATKVLMKAILGDGGELRVCVKGGFRPELMAQMSASYQVEARFYGELGTRLERGIPGCHFAGVDDAGQGVVVLDDLRGRDTGFGDPRLPVSPDLVATALEGQASWHATGHEIPDWLPRTPLWQGVIEGLLSEANWTLQVEGGKAADLPEPLRRRDRYLAGLHASWAEDARDVGGIVHGDTNVTNLVIAEGAQPFFLDWQLTCTAHWAHDVTLFLIGSLAVEDRRAHERDLIATYAQARRARGDDLDDDAAFDAYRRHMLHGLMYAFIPDEMQPVEVCAPFVQRFAAAITDHGTLGLLTG